MPNAKPANDAIRNETHNDTSPQTALRRLWRKLTLRHSFAEWPLFAHSRRPMRRVRPAENPSAVVDQASNRFALDLNDPLLDQPVHRFAHRLDRLIAGSIAEHALRFGDAGCIVAAWRVRRSGAVPAAKASKHPIVPQEQTGPSRAMRRCPTWPAMPRRPCNSRPSTTTPPPTPVLTLT